MAIPDDDTVRDMDGSALTRLAYDLGLAPEDTALHNNAIQFYDNNNPYMTAWLKIWSPHKDINQARTLFFDVLGTQAWIVRVEQMGSMGSCTAVQPLAQATGAPLCLEESWRASHSSPPLALLRCAVRAVLAQRRREKE